MKTQDPAPQRTSVVTRISAALHKTGPGLRRVMENISWLIVDRVIRMGMGLVVGVWVARYLGPSQFGSLNFALAFVALFGTLGTLGLDGIVVKEILHRADETHHLLGTSLALRTGGSILAMLLSIGALVLLQPHDRQALVLVSILAPTLVFQSFDTVDYFFQSQVRSKITVWAKNLAFLIFVVVRLTLIFRRAPLWTFAAASTGEIALGAAGLTLGYRLAGGKMLAWRSSRKIAVDLLKKSWPAIFSGLAIMIYMRIDMVMLKVMRGDFEVGLYAAATRVSEVWYFIPSAIVTSVAPAIMRSKHLPEVYYRRLQNLFFGMTYCSCIIGGVIALASGAIIHLLYSNAYRSAGPVLAVHVWASVFVFLGVAQSPWDVTENLLNLALYRTVAGGVLNIAVNVFLIPRYGAMGAAIATVSSYGVSAVLGNAFHPRTRPIFFMQLKSFVPRKFWRVADEVR